MRATNHSIKTPNDETTIRNLQHQFDQAQVKADFLTIEKLLAPDVMFIGPKGFITDVEEWLSVHRSGEYKQTVMAGSEIDVRMYGHTAIVYDLKHSECEFKGDVIKGDFRAIQVWIKRRDHWQLTAVQFTPMTGH